MATMSLLGLYNYDESLLDGLIESLPNKYGIPSGYEDSYYTDVAIDPQTVVENLLYFLCCCFHLPCCLFSHGSENLCCHKH